MDYIFQILDTDDVSAKYKMSSLDVLSSNSENDIANINKSHDFVRKPKNYLRKPKNYLKKP